MNKYFLVPIIALSLTGCATLKNARDHVCENKEIVREQVEQQMHDAIDIQDPIKYAAIMASLALTIAALDHCPKTTI